MRELLQCGYYPRPASGYATGQGKMRCTSVSVIPTNSITFLISVAWHNTTLNRLTNGCFRNGTETRILLPLWKGEAEGRCRTGAVERVHGESGFRNGTETWVLLPLWKREAEGRCRTGACREGAWGKRPPQRHRNVGFAAVVEKGMEGRCRTGAVERVHGESGFRNGTETWILLPLWKGGWIIWPGEAGTNDFCYFWGVN